MNILYIAYWGVQESLTVSTVYPNLLLLRELPHVQQIILVTIERKKVAVELNETFIKNNIGHYPLYSMNLTPNVLNKSSDFYLFPEQIEKICVEHKIDCILARTAPAGILAYLVNQKIKIPFIVESFEPHADYMQEVGVWSKNGLRYWYQKMYERKQTNTASHLVTVTNNYKQYLIDCGVSADKIDVVACYTDLQKFNYNPEAKQKIRQQLGWSNDVTVGIYVGKFGDLYYDDDAFMIFKHAFDVFGVNYRMIILTPETKEHVEEQLVKFEIDPTKVHVDFVSHSKIPAFLSASDFAFSTVRSVSNSKYCSPVKDGEYWANGLPILLTEGVGDDADIISTEGGGALFNLKKQDVVDALKNIQYIIEQKDYRKPIVHLADKYRNMNLGREVYTRIFTS